MNLQRASVKDICSQRGEIAAYVDGELLPVEELDLERHFADCDDCRNELNEQKKLLQALDFALENEREIELPANFARVIAANAESKVSGLRRPQERGKALFVCAALFLAVILGMGGEVGTILSAFGKFAEQVFAVGGFALHLLYDISVGAAVILRSLNNQSIVSSTIFLTVAACVCLFGILRLTNRSQRL